MANSLRPYLSDSVPVVYEVMLWTSAPAAIIRPICQGVKLSICIFVGTKLASIPYANIPEMPSSRNV